MRKFILLLFIMPLSCLNPTIKEERGLSPDQIKLKRLIDNYTSEYESLPNQMSQDHLRNSFPGKVHIYIRDSLKGVLKNCKVKMTELKEVPIQNITAFYATFEDSLSNKYWMEFDYKDFQINDLYKNPAYVLLKNMPENVDTVLTFLYNGETEWEDDVSNYDNDLKIRIVPYPKNYDFDSGKNNNN